MHLVDFLPFVNGIALIFVSVVGWFLRQALMKFSHLEITLTQMTITLTKLDAMIDSHAQLNEMRFAFVNDRLVKLEHKSGIGV